jgi:uncharacterized protein YidB (DUF937 family)
MSGLLGILGGLLSSNSQEGAAGAAGSAGNLLSSVLASSGGVSGLVQKFEQAGLGETVSSWVGSGGNLPVSVQQVLQVIPQDKIEALAEQHGIPAGVATQLLAQLLPHAVDAATPAGQVPPAGTTPPVDFASLVGRVLGGQASRAQA